MNVVSRGTGGTDSARYCYSAWLRHLSLAHKNGLPTQFDVVAELGPGDSLGIGLAALLSGANQYYALDVVQHANLEKNLRVFDELASLFARREPMPDEAEFPTLKPYLQSYEFPGHVLTEARLQQALRPGRLESIRNAIANPNGGGADRISICYFVPWHDRLTIREASVDLVCSQAVLEHVDDLENAYRALHRWLKAGGVMSHQIDFRCHKTARAWNGHWAHSDLVWGLMRGKRHYLLNRQPHSRHVNLMQAAGFEIVCDMALRGPSGVARKRLASRFRNMSDDDLATSGAFIQAVKRA